MTDQPPFLLSDIQAWVAKYHNVIAPAPVLRALCDVVEAAQFLTAWVEEGSEHCPNRACYYQYHNRFDEPQHSADCPFPRLIEALAKFTIEQETT